MSQTRRGLADMADKPSVTVSSRRTSPLRDVPRTLSPAAKARLESQRQAAPAAAAAAASTVTRPTSRPVSPTRATDRAFPDARPGTPVKRPREDKMVSLGVFDEEEIPKSMNAMWVVYRSMINVAEKAGIETEELMKPLKHAMNELANGRSIKIQSNGEAKSKIEMFLSEKGGNTDAIYASVASLVGSQGTTVISTRHSKNKDAAKRVTTEELLLPGLKKHIKPDSTFFDFKTQHSADARSLTSAFVNFHYGKTRSIGDASRGVTVTREFADYVKSKPLLPAKIATPRQTAYLAHLNSVKASLRVGEVIPFDLAIQLYAKTASDVFKGENGVPLLNIEGQPIPWFQVVKNAETLLHMTKKDASTEKLLAPADKVGEWMFWKVIGQSKVESKASA